MKQRVHFSIFFQTMVQPVNRAAAHNIFQDLKEWIVSIPQITRYLFIGTAAFSLGTKLGACSVLQLVLFFEPLYDKYQLWRLFTTHLYSSGQGLFWHMYLLYQQSKDLETGHFAGKKADYFWTVLQIMLLLDIVGIYFSMPLLTEAFGMAITYLYSQVKADQLVTFFFGMQFKVTFIYV
jgi:hypothetical protein